MAATAWSSRSSRFGTCGRRTPLDRACPGSSTALRRSGTGHGHRAVADTGQLRRRPRCGDAACVVVLNSIHPGAFRELHPDTRNDRCCLPCRYHGRKALRCREPGGTFRWLMSCLTRWRALCRASSRTTPPTRCAASRWRCWPTWSWTLGDVMAKSAVLPARRRRRDAVARRVRHVDGAGSYGGAAQRTGWRRVMPVRWGLGTGTCRAAAFVSVHLVQFLAVMALADTYAVGYIGAVDDDGAGGADCWASGSAGGGRFPPGWFRRRAVMLRPGGAVDPGAGAAAGRHRWHGGDPDHDAAAVDDRDAGVPGVLATGWHTVAGLACYRGCRARVRSALLVWLALAVLGLSAGWRIACSRGAYALAPVSALAPYEYTVLLWGGSRGFWCSATCRGGTRWSVPSWWRRPAPITCTANGCAARRSAPPPVERYRRI